LELRSAQLFLGDSMMREDIPIPTGCVANSNDRTRILVTIEPGLDDLLSVVDEAEQPGQTPPEGPVALYLASYGNGGEDNG
jgi:hypothetical protein